MFTLSQALEAIKNKPEFGVYKREFGTVIDYNLSMTSTFIGDTPEQTKILQNLRGTCFNEDGKIISLPWHKFHNLNECPGYLEADIPDVPYVIQEKLDGSMVRVIPDGAGYRLGTRAGVTDVSIKAEKWLEKQTNVHNYDEFICYWMIADWTPIFEYIGRDNRIVVDYPESNLILTGIRENKTGRYAPQDWLRSIARDYQIPVVKVRLDSSASIRELADFVREMKGEEGVVLAFENDFRLKIKGTEYATFHRALDGLRFEKDVIKIILDGTLDDVLPLVTPDMKERLIKFQTSLVGTIEELDVRTHAMFLGINEAFPGAKEFAGLVNKFFPLLAPGLFAIRNGKFTSWKAFALKRINSSTTIAENRWLFGPSFDSF